jgi:hypothetical protein
MSATHTLVRDSNIYQLLWNIENSNQLPQQLMHTRTKFYIYAIPEYRAVLSVTPLSEGKMVMN